MSQHEDDDLVVEEDGPKYLLSRYTRTRAANRFAVRTLHNLQRICMTRGNDMPPEAIFTQTIVMFRDREWNFNRLLSKKSLFREEDSMTLREKASRWLVFFFAVKEAHQFIKGRMGRQAPLFPRVLSWGLMAPYGA